MAPRKKWGPGTRQLHWVDNNRPAITSISMPGSRARGPVGPCHKATAQIWGFICPFLGPLNPAVPISRLGYACKPRSTPHTLLGYQPSVALTQATTMRLETSLVRCAEQQNTSISKIAPNEISQFSHWTNPSDCHLMEYQASNARPPTMVLYFHNPLLHNFASTFASDGSAIWQPLHDNVPPRYGRWW